MVEAEASACAEISSQARRNVVIDTLPQLAVLSELLLRGAQTLGELRSRAERMHPFHH